MINIMLSGCNGVMGRAIANTVKKSDISKIVVGIDINTEISNDFPVLSNPFDYQGKPDVIIDFSHPSALDTILDYAIQNRIPAILATTGYSEEQLAKIKDASSTIAVFQSYNMSIGISLMAALCQKAAQILGDDFDIEIVEKHHNQKIDAPSGTAILLANRINEGLDSPYQYVYDRHTRRQKRDAKEIGISSLRGGTIVGEHSVFYAGNQEILEIKHTATSKEVFALGAVRAAAWIIDKKPSFYDMQDYMKSIF